MKVKQEFMVHGRVQSRTTEQTMFPPITNAELVQLRVRVIALENLVITLPARASDRRLFLAREMAGYISPRSGATHHPLTLRAAAQMVNLVERADHCQATIPTAAC